MYVYQAKILKVHDGDTCTALVDLGFRINQEMPLRLHGINAPELSNKPFGLYARERLKSLIEGKTVTIHTYKDAKEKYGRYLALIFLGESEISVNDELVTSGHAVPVGW